MGAGIRKPIKPSRPIINFNHPITKGLQFDAPLTERGGLKTTDIAGRLAGTILSSTWATDRYGPVLNYSATDSNVSFTTPSGNPMTSATVFSYEAMYSATGLGGGSIGYLFLKGKTAIRFFVQIKAGPVMNIFANYATLDGTWSFPTTTDGAWHHLVVTMNYATAGTAPVVYHDGVLATLTPGDIPSGATVADDGLLVVGNNAITAGTRNWQGQIGYLRGWNRILNAQEARQLYTNPWCIYQPTNPKPVGK